MSPEQHENLCKAIDGVSTAVFCLASVVGVVTFFLAIIAGKL